MKQSITKAIIFDFMRTLYDPEKGRLFYGVKKILQLLSKSHDLYLISYKEHTREQLIQSLGIETYFKQIHFVEVKNKRAFIKALHGKKYSKIWVVGDRIEGEIKIGNSFNHQTIWLKQGKYATREPHRKDEHPKYIIHTIRELIRHLR
jgi:FMN phosphatase YigB (HAD superfamily)